MAALVGAIEDGTYTKSTASTEATGGSSTTSTSKTASSTGTEYNQEMFLQLLIAEMQYQDPLEPTSNTEYVSELASFTQIETIQAVQDDMKTIQADSLVGQYVILLEDNEYVSGKVDYVYNDGGDLYLSVNDSLHSLDTLDSVVDEDYYVAVISAETFTDAVNSLPSVSALELTDEDSLVAAREMFDAMDTYTKGFVSSDTYSILTELETRMEALKKASETEETEEEETEDTEDEDTTVDTE